MAPQLVQIGAVTIDLCDSYSWELVSEYTSHPVEVGAPVTDFAIDKPVTLTVEATFSDTPIDRNAAIRAQAAIGNVTDGTIARAPGASKAQRDRLDLYRKNKTVVRVVTPTKVHDSMVVESISEPRDASTGRGVMLSIQLVEITFAEAKSVQVKAIPGAKKRKGFQVTDPKSDDDPEMLRRSAIANAWFGERDSIADAWRGDLGRERYEQKRSLGNPGR